MTEAEIHDAYRLHKDAVYRFAWRMTGSASTAEDILHDCFVSLLRNPGIYDSDRAPMRPFLLAIARNLARNRWRLERRWSALDEEAFAAQSVDPATGQVADLVARSIQFLPPLQREALILFEYEQLSLEEIARTVDAEVGTIKSRLYRARENLRIMLAPLRPTHTVEQENR